MKDKNFNYKKGNSTEEKINIIKNIISLLSQKLEMNLNYLDIESIINSKNKESVKSILVLFINILTVNEIQKQKLINIHFNNDIKILKRNCVTEKKKNNIKTGVDANISFDMKKFVEKNEKTKNINLKNKFDEYIKNIQNNIEKNLRNIYRPMSVDKMINKEKGKKTDLKVFYIPPRKIEEETEDILENKNEYFNVKEIGKNNYHIFLSKKDLIYEIIKIIKNNVSHQDFYNFLVKNTFPKKMLNIIQKIYNLHFLRHKNINISKHFLQAHINDIISIIKKEVNPPKKKNKSIKMKNNNKSNKNNINILSNLFKNILWLKNYHDSNCLKAGYEIKDKKINYEYQLNKSKKYINDFHRLFLKLISVERNKNLEDKELQTFMHNMNYYQIITQKDDIFKTLRNTFDELKSNKNISFV